MKTTTQFFTLLAAALLLSSFSFTNPYDFIGTYGVSEADPAQIQLVIRADQTFTYQDMSSASNKINVSGSWTYTNGKVTLTDAKSDVRFHNVWSIEKDGQVAKSRKGLSFYRLCKISD